MANDSSTSAKSNSRWRRLSIKRIILSFVIAAVLLAPYAGYAIYHWFNETMIDLYAQWWVADMVVEYMDRNDGAWPHNWDDLEEPFEICAAQSGRAWTFEQLQSHVTVDFEADPKQLAKAVISRGKPPFQVIFLSNGKTHHWEGSEPNTIIWDYLQEREKQGPRHHSPKRLDPQEKAARKGLLANGARWKMDDGGRVIEVQMASAPGSKQSTDTDMIHLKQLKRLRSLNLGDCDVSDAGLESVKGLPNLEEIFLYRTKVSDDGLKYLEESPKLATLVLADVRFTDAALEHVARMQNLTFLNLSGARVTDAGLLRLHGLKNLRDVSLYGTLVSEDGVKQLQQALPSCKVDSDYRSGR